MVCTFKSIIFHAHQHSLHTCMFNKNSHSTHAKISSVHTSPTPDVLAHFDFSHSRHLSHLTLTSLHILPPQNSCSFPTFPSQALMIYLPHIPGTFPSLYMHHFSLPHFPCLSWIPHITSPTPHAPTLHFSHISRFPYFTFRGVPKSSPSCYVTSR